MTGEGRAVRQLSWTNQMPNEKGMYVARRKGCMLYLEWIQRDRKSGELFFRDVGGKQFRKDWPTDRRWLGPLPK